MLFENPEEHLKRSAVQNVCTRTDYTHFLPLTASLSPLRAIRQLFWLAASHSTLDESRHDNAATTRQLNANAPKRRSPLKRDDGTS